MDTDRQLEQVLQEFAEKLEELKKVAEASGKVQKDPLNEKLETAIAKALAKLDTASSISDKLDELERLKIAIAICEEIKLAYEQHMNNVEKPNIMHKIMFTFFKEFTNELKKVYSARKKRTEKKITNKRKKS